MSRFVFWCLWGPITAFAAWGLYSLAQRPTPQQPWECRPQPGYCDIDTDWRPPAWGHLEQGK
jgi:hypothetical protein